MKYTLLAKLCVWPGAVSVQRILQPHLLLMCARALEREGVGSGALELHTWTMPG